MPVRRRKLEHSRKGKQSRSAAAAAAAHNHDDDDSDDHDVSSDDHNDDGEHSAEKSDNHDHLEEQEQEEEEEPMLIRGGSYALPPPILADNAGVDPEESPFDSEDDQTDTEFKDDPNDEDYHSDDGPDDDSDDDDGDVDEYDDDDDDDDFVTRKRRSTRSKQTKTKSRGGSNARGGARNGARSSSAGKRDSARRSTAARDFSDDEDDSDDDFQQQRSRRATPSRQSARKAKSRIQSYKEDDDEEDEEYENNHNHDDDDDANDSDVVPPPRRRTSSKTSKKSSINASKRSAQKKKKRKNDDDDDFVADDDEVEYEEEDEEESSFSEHSEDSEEVGLVRDNDIGSDGEDEDFGEEKKESRNDDDRLHHRLKKTKKRLSSSSKTASKSKRAGGGSTGRRLSRRKGGLLKDDDSDFEGDEEDSDDDVAINHHQHCNHTHKRHNHRHSYALSSSDDDDDDDDDDLKSPHHGKSQMESPPKIPSCSTTEDAITNEELPPVHICFISPDGQTKSCFALETLRKIALMNKNPTIVREDGKTAWLQPPHFRSKMSDDLEDQIMSRFGRDALDIDGPYYRRDHTTQPKLKDGESFDAPESSNGRRQSDDHVSDIFRERFQKYVNNVMGSRDLYVCPLCYTVAYNNIHNESFRKAKSPSKRRRGGRASADVSIRYSLEFDLDPISILMMDDHKLDVASTFCFRTIANTKKHLINDHGLAKKNVISKELNELYRRFQVRTQDGLLQRYTKAQCGERTALTGDLQQYWHYGNNLDFVHLLDLVQDADMYRNIVTNLSTGDITSVEATDLAEAEEYLGAGMKFFKSFKQDAKALWELISGPYQTNKDDMNDFLAGEDSGVDEDGVGEEEAGVGVSAQAVLWDERRRSIEAEREAQEAYVKDIEKRANADRGDNSEGDDAGCSDYGIDVEDQSEDAFAPSEDEGQDDDDDDDEWIKSKQKSMQKRLSTSVGKKKGARRRESKTSKKSGQHRALGDSSDDDYKRPSSSTQQQSGKRKRLAIQDDSSEDEDFAGAENVKVAPVSSKNGNRKRLSIEESESEYED